MSKSAAITFSSTGPAWLLCDSVEGMRQLLPPSAGGLEESSVPEDDRFWSVAWPALLRKTLRAGAVSCFVCLVEQATHKAPRQLPSFVLAELIMAHRRSLNTGQGLGQLHQRQIMVARKLEGTRQHVGPDAFAHWADMGGWGGMQFRDFQKNMPSWEKSVMRVVHTPCHMQAVIEALVPSLDEDGRLPQAKTAFTLDVRKNVLHQVPAPMRSSFEQGLTQRLSELWTAWEPSKPSKQRRPEEMALGADYWARWYADNIKTLNVPPTMTFWTSWLAGESALPESLPSHPHPTHLFDEWFMVLATVARVGETACPPAPDGWTWTPRAAFGLGSFLARQSTNPHARFDRMCERVVSAEMHMTRWGLATRDTDTALEEGLAQGGLTLDALRPYVRSNHAAEWDMVRTARALAWLPSGLPSGPSRRSARI